MTQVISSTPLRGQCYGFKNIVAKNGDFYSNIILGAEKMIKTLVFKEKRQFFR
jgi:hypothetical protein